MRPQTAFLCLRSARNSAARVKRAVFRSRTLPNGCTSAASIWRRSKTRIGTSIGAPVYVRGFMRTYARFLGLDPEAAVARFSSAVPPGTPAATTARPAAAPNAAEKRAAPSGPAPRWPRSFRSSWPSAVVLFVGYEFYQYRGRRARRSGGPKLAPAPTRRPRPPAALRRPPLPEAGDAAGTLAAIPPLASPVPAAPKGPKRGLSVHVTETSWLRVTVDGTVVLEGTLPAGAAKSFTGKVADVRVGNAGGVQIAVNGRPLGPLGGVR